MKKITVLLTMCLFLTFNVGYSMRAYAQTGNIEADAVVKETIEAEEVAKDLAKSADGLYVKGEAVPVTEGTEIALPILDESSGNVLGHIVADKEKLVSVLQEEGLTEVAYALAASETGAASAETVTAGIIGGTIAWTSVGVAALVGIGLAVGGSGGGGGGSSGGGTTTPTPNH